MPQSHRLSTSGTGAAILSSRAIAEHRRAVSLTQEGIDNIALRVQSDRVRALLSRYRFALAQVAAVEDFDDSRIADCRVQMLLLSVKEDHVGHPAEFRATENLT